MQADQSRLGSIESSIANFERTLDQTDAAARSLKQTVATAVDVTLGGVPDNRFSAAGRQAAASARSGLAATRNRLSEMLNQYQREDRAYHEQVRQEQLRRQREREAQKRREREERERRELEERAAGGGA